MSSSPGVFAADVRNLAGSSRLPAQSRDRGPAVAHRGRRSKMRNGLQPSASNTRQAIPRRAASTLGRLVPAPIGRWIGKVPAVSSQDTSSDVPNVAGKRTRSAKIVHFFIVPGVRRDYDTWERVYAELRRGWSVGLVIRRFDFLAFGADWPLGRIRPGFICGTFLALAR